MTITRREYGKGHSYYVDGVKFDCVTSLISKGLPKPALPYWSARTVAEYVADNLDTVAAMRDMGRASIVAALKEVPWTARTAAAAKGTEVHALAEKLVAGVEVDVPEPLAGHVESYVKFLDEWKIEPLLVEATVAHRKWRYCGTLDLVGRMPNGRIALMDVKTSASGVFPETGYQLAAYRHAEVYVDRAGDEPPMTDLDIEAGYAIWVRADGYDVLPVKCDEAVFKDFLHIAWTARAVERNKDLVGEAISHD